MSQMHSKQSGGGLFKSLLEAAHTVKNFVLLILTASIYDNTGILNKLFNKIVHNSKHCLHSLLATERDHSVIGQ